MSNTMATLNYLELPGSGRFEETKRFYTAAFGWSWLDFGPTYAEFRDAGMQGGLNGLATATPPPADGAEDGFGPLVLFETDDLEAVLRAVEEAGATVSSPPYRYPGGRRFHFRDPAGNTLGVYQSSPSSE